MPFSIHVDPVRRVSYVRMSDTVTFDDLGAAQRALVAEPAFDPTFPLRMSCGRVRRSKKPRRG